MIDIKRKEDCCGCGACAQACPRKCISLSEDPEGFLYPVADTASCIHCGICTAVCPILTSTKPEGSVLQTYAAYAKDETIRTASSSGGIFSLLAQWILDQGGVVFGAAYAEDYSVHHVMISSREELSLLRGSKYLQSRIEETYIQVKAMLDTGKTVLFSGVGCQIAGLKAYLKIDHPQLYTVDVLCHGVPSPKVWRSYLREQQQRFGSDVEAVSFRDKTSGWTHFSMCLRFRNGQTYLANLSEDIFFQFFLENISLRPACHSCRFKELPHAADLTLGDAWGIASQMPDMHDDRGVSLVLVNTEKGQRLFDAVGAEILSQPGDTDQLLPPYADSRTSVAPHTRRAPFFSAVAKDASIEQLRKILRGNLLRKALSCGKRAVKKLISKN